MWLPHTPRPTLYPASRSGGFTLVELSIVILVLSLLMTGAVMFYNGRLEQQKEAETWRRMAIIEESLLLYRRAFGRLPCPSSGAANILDDTFGKELGTPGTDCAGATNLTGGSNNGRLGVLPSKTLQLPDEMMFDGWGNRFTYAVDVRYTLTNAFLTYPITNATGDLYVYNTTGGNAKSASSIYVVISHGKNGHGAYSRGGTVISAGSTNTDELNNCSCTLTGAAGTLDNIFIQKFATASTTLTDTFDDILLYKRRPQMFSITTPEVPPVTTY